MCKGKLKERIKSVKKATWIYLAIITAFVLVGIGLGIWAIYLSGYTLATWLANFYPWVILVVGVIVLVLGSVLLTKYRKGK